MTALSRLLRWLFGSSELPYLSRPTYRCELIGVILQTVAVASEASTR